MPKKKTTTIVEEDPQELDYNKDLKDKTFEQVAETPTDEKKEEPKEEEKVEEKVEEKPAFDPEQLKREAADLAKQEMAEQLKGETKEETQEKLDHYQQFQEDFLKANNRQPTWFEVARDMEEQTILKVEAKQAEQAKAREQEQKTQQEAYQKQNEDTNKYIDQTLGELYEAEKLPVIKDPKDTDDFGVKTKNALLTKVVEVNTRRIEQNLPPKTLKEIFYEDFELPRREVPGGREPVNMGRGGTPEETQEMDYREIHGPRNSFKNILSALKRGA